MKKVLSMILAVAVVFSLMPSAGAIRLTKENKKWRFNYEMGTEIKRDWSFGENIEWTLDEKGTLVIDGSGMLTVALENYYEDLDFSDYSAYENREWERFSKIIKRVIINDGITEIGENSFTGFTYMRTVTIPNSVERIGPDAFGLCESLKNVVIPDSVTEIEPFAFTHCYYLKNIIFPKNISVIKAGVLANCPKLKNIYIHKNVTDIEEYAFNSSYIAPTFTIYYEGTREEWEKINIAEENKHLSDCRVICNADGIPASEILNCYSSPWRI